MNNTPIGMDKVANVAARASKIASALADENDALRAEIAQLQSKIASLERSDRVRFLASEMDARGLNADLTLEEKIASLDKVDDLDRVEAAIKLAGAGSLDLASVADEMPSDDGDSQNSLHHFLVRGG